MCLRGGGGKGCSAPIQQFGAVDYCSLNLKGRLIPTAIRICLAIYNYLLSLESI